MERQELEQALESWQNGRASLADIRGLTRELAKQQFAPGIPALVQLLDHADEIVRYGAAKALGFDLQHKPATDKLLFMLTEDADEDVRSVAAGALRTIWQNTKQPRILKALAKVALTDRDEDLRSDAYRALLVVNGVPREEHLRLLTSENLPVDPARVKTILNELSE